MRNRLRMNEECQCPLETNPNARLGLCTSVSLPSPPPPISYYICSKTFAGTHYSPFSCGSDLCWYFRRFVHVISMCTHSSTNNCLQFMQTNKRSKMLKVFFFSFFLLFALLTQKHNIYVFFNLSKDWRQFSALFFIEISSFARSMCIFHFIFFMSTSLQKSITKQWMKRISNIEKHSTYVVWILTKITQGMEWDKKEESIE